MGMKESVINAFHVIGVSPDTPEERAARAYKRLALEHHPDRNLDDVAKATTRFQEIGAAWEICARHYENPQSSEEFAAGYDEDIFYDVGKDEMFYYYEYMLHEMFMNAEIRFSRKGFRSQRQSGYGSSLKSFHSHPFHRSSYSGVHSSDHETLNEKRQRKEKEKYEQRIREFEAECAQRDREEAEAEHEKRLQAQQRASAQAEAFALARSGNSKGVQNIVLRHSLDVTGPEKVPKQQKRGTLTNYKTLLHVAASKCDIELVTFLLDKGADISALNKDNLTPFHLAILSGNTPVVRYFLTRHGKSSEGYHPSKAVDDGRTPLQMAIASGSASAVELLLKDATVHDVERCWEQLSLPDALRDILGTKKGFCPRSPGSNGPPMSRKAALKAEVARKQAAEREEKAQRIAGERARAAENLQKKQERAAKRAEVEHAKEVAHLQSEAEERQQAEVATLETDQAKSKAEEEERIAAEREAESRRVDEEEHQKVRSKAGQETRRKAAIDYAQEKHRKRLEKAGPKAEVERQMEIEMTAERQKQAEAELQNRQKEADLHRKEAEAHQRADVHEAVVEQCQTTRVEASVSRSERNAQVNHNKKREVKSQSKRMVSQRPVVVAEAKRAETLRRLQAQAEEHERLKLRRQQATPQSVAPPVVASSVKAAVGTDSKREAIMRKRAAQSARDKARHQRMKEEKALRESAKQAELSIGSLSLAREELQEDKKADITTPPHRQSTYPLTPISICPSPVSWLETPYEGSGTVTGPITPPMTPEDLQTCAIPEDLFAYAPPTNTHPTLLSSPLPGNRGRHGYRGRGWRGRGRGRGGYVTGHDGNRLGASYSTRREAEQALAEKNLEIERLTAELASLRAGLR